MKNTSKWIVAIAVLLVSIFALSYMFTTYGYGGMMAGGYARMHGSMMGGGSMNYGTWLGWAIWGVLFLASLYGVSRLATGSHEEVPLRTCNECGQEIEVEWKNCPYCGTTV